MQTSYQITPKLHLHQLTIEGAKAKPAPTSVNHIAVVDCSGSMYGELDKLRVGLKAKLPTLLREGDTFSMIWFSGRGQFGPILEGETVNTLRDLGKVNQAIDRWLRPQGLTGFKEPLQEVERLIERLKPNQKAFSLFFMSDGMDNQWPRQDVLATVEKVAGKLVSSTFVEYGFYADRQMLSAMATKAGGQLVHCDAFPKFEPLLDNMLVKTLTKGARVEVQLPDHVIGDFVFEMTNAGELITYGREDNKALVSPETNAIYWLSEHHAVSYGGDAVVVAYATRAQYAAMSLFAVRMKPEIVFPILKSLGDVRFIQLFASCFGKQAYSTFMDAAKGAAFDTRQRDVNGNNPALVPADDAFNVVELLNLLSTDEDTRIMLDDPSFDYSKISRETLNADENLTVAEQEAVAGLNSLISKERNAKKIDELQVQIKAITDRKREGLKFVADVETEGYAISSLTFNETSPNISVLIRKTGTVDLTSRLNSAPAPTYPMPIDFPTHIFRNYAIIAHGIVNVKTLPVDISKSMYRELVAQGVKLSDNERGVTCIDLTTLPIINREMVKGVTLRDAARIAWRLQMSRAAQKVYKDYVNAKYPGEKLAGYSEKYGEAGALWLKENGLTSHNGFSPPRTQADSTDFIMGKELEFKIKGYSTLPPVAKVAEKVKAKAKLNGPETLMAAAMLEVELFLKESPEKLHEAWLLGKEKANGAEVRGLAYQLSQIVFSIVVGQTWFADCATPDDNVIMYSTSMGDIVVTAELREVEIKL